MTTALTAAQRAELGVLLKDRLATLEETLAAQEGGLSRVDAAAELLEQNREDGTQRDADREVAQQRADIGHQELGLVRQALQRLDTPSYGLCLQCGQPISWSRLKAEPWTLHCVTCERTHDQAPAQPASL
ncbi:TraR/DksA C4-type zinc finger protein [Ideonella sp. B7]|uniref:TraR/DksA family transcriptional regulator n=1 Tax=Ideonella benzenivorans TaxID=2831643 RepID=UPI001CEDF6DE|nr:TraR/DksA C4-type zinc finger protein [Ideonella benzenivorans]MCA6218138.1 TraR/DksA C4-type zinc finger protein [Ideonella benzenivorans]